MNWSAFWGGYVGTIFGIITLVIGFLGMDHWLCVARHRKWRALSDNRDC